jgi:hypothetical protein
LTSDGGLLAYRDLDEALGLFDSVPTAISDSRNGRNIQHGMTNLLRQSAYSRLAGYEDINDAQRLSVDPVMRAVTGKNKQWSLWTLLTKLIKIGAKVARHSKYVTFQMAEVAISKEIFSEILFRINRLRHCSL